MINLSRVYDLKTAKNRGGFTLMEMLIALSILASALAVLMGTMANSGQQSVYAADLTTATYLAKSKMIDIEYEVAAEGFPTTEQKYSGDFREDGRADMIWTATVVTVEIPEEAKEALLAKTNSQLFGQESGGLKGNPGISSMLPTLIGQIPTWINQIGKKVRKIDLKVEFPFGSGMRPITVTQYIVDPNTKDFNIFGDLNQDDF